MTWLGTDILVMIYAVILYSLLLEKVYTRNNHLNGLSVSSEICNRRVFPLYYPTTFM